MDRARLAERAMAVLLPVLIVMTLVLEAFAWPVTLALSGKFNGVSHEQFAFAVTLSRITIPYLMLISLVPGLTFDVLTPMPCSPLSIKAFTVPQ